MTLTVTDLHRIAVHEALAVLGDVYGRTPDADTAETWRTGLPPVPAEVVSATARRWVATEDRHPSMAAFGVACQTEARRRTEVARGSSYDGPDPEGRARCQRGFKVVHAAYAAESTAEETWAALTEAGVLTGDDGPTHRCPSCQDSGSVFNVAGAWRPCDGCDLAAWTHWNEHFRHGRHHRCDGCVRHGRPATA